MTSDSTSVPQWTSITATKVTEGVEGAMLYIWIGLGLCLVLGLVAVVLLSVVFRFYLKRYQAKFIFEFNFLK
jgi:hypothetical protein